MRSAPGKTTVLGWGPENVLAEVAELRRVAEVLDDLAPRPSKVMESLRVSHTWSGDAQSAAEDWAKADSDRIQLVAHATRFLESAVVDGVTRFADARQQVATAIESVEVAGWVVSEDWVISGDGIDPALREEHQRNLRRCLSELHRSGAEAARSIDHALKKFGAGPDLLGFVPLVIGLVFVIDAAVAALISAGLVSAGAILFALVDEFGSMRGTRSKVLSRVRSSKTLARLMKMESRTTSEMQRYLAGVPRSDRLRTSNNSEICGIR